MIASLRLAAACAFLACFATAFAAIGDPPEALIEELNAHSPVEVDEGVYRLGEEFEFELTLRNGVVYSVSGRATLDESNRTKLADLVAAATGYGAAIANPVARFLATRVPEFAGRGPGAVAVESYQLTLTVEGELEPFRVAFELSRTEVPAELFPTTARSLGPDDARYVVREFGDFECPYCAAFANEVMPRLREELLARGDVRFEYHHLPLSSIHPNALPAAAAAECVADVAGADGFWDFHDALFTRQAEWAPLLAPEPYFWDLAGEQGADVAAVTACIQEGRFLAEVENDYRHAVAILGLNSTPTLFVNGYRVENPQDVASILELVDLVDAFDVE